MNKKTIKIKFSEMSGNFNPNNNFITNILKTRYDVILSDDPDFLVYSVVSKNYLDYKCPRIYYTPENLVPDFNICDYGIGFSYLSFGDRYIRYPIYLVESFKAYTGDNYATDLDLAQNKHLKAEDLFKEKEEFCSFVYSNSDGAMCRRAIFDELSKYKKVNSGGRYLNNVGSPVDNKLEFQKKHKFVIAFENTSSTGYTTEKIINAFASGAIPIYWGNPEIKQEFNPDSFINCHDYGLTEKGEIEAINKIIERVIYLDQNDDEYLKMLKTPAFQKSNYVKKKHEEISTFLFNIFDQEKEKAYRRNRYYWGERYERKQKIGNKFYWFCRKIIPIRDKIRKLIRK